GGTLLDQLARAAPALRSKFNLDLRVRAIGGSKSMVFDEQRLDLGRWRDSLKGGAPMDGGKFVNHIQADYLPHAVIIDCTASQEVADRYAAWLERGIHVITTLKDLVETGDEIRSISGIFSGTLAYLFNLFDGTRPFSEIVREAKAK